MSICDAQGKPAFYMKTEWRCTTKPGKLYVHFFKWPGTKFEVTLKNKVNKAYLLSDKRKALKVEQADGKVAVALPEQAPDKMASVLCLEIERGS